MSTRTLFPAIFHAGNWGPVRSPVNGLPWIFLLHRVSWIGSRRKRRHKRGRKTSRYREDTLIFSVVPAITRERESNERSDGQKLLLSPIYIHRDGNSITSSNVYRARFFPSLQFGAILEPVPLWRFVTNDERGQQENRFEEREGDDYSSRIKRVPRPIIPNFSSPRGTRRREENISGHANVRRAFPRLPPRRIVGIPCLEFNSRPVNGDLGRIVATTRCWWMQSRKSPAANWNDGERRER